MGIQSSLHMPDKVLNFVKDHFLMDSVIRSAPLLLKRSVRYTQIAVHKIQGMERAYDVLFIGTGTDRYTTKTFILICSSSFRVKRFIPALWTTQDTCVDSICHLKTPDVASSSSNNCPLFLSSVPYTCFLCLPDDGKLHKAINANDKMHIIEELILFPEPQPVQHIELDPQRVNNNSIIMSFNQFKHIYFQHIYYEYRYTGLCS